MNWAASILQPQLCHDGAELLSMVPMMPVPMSAAHSCSMKWAASILQPQLCRAAIHGAAGAASTLAAPAPPLMAPAPPLSAIDLKSPSYSPIP